MNSVTIRPWEIVNNDFMMDKGYRESIFSQGNGCIGVRGYLPEGRKNDNAHRSTFLAGFFEYIRPGITDMVNQPEFSCSQLILNGINTNDLAVEEFSESLNMRDGTLRWNYTVVDQNNCRTGIETTRFLSMDNTHAAAVRFQIKPINYDGTLLFETGIDGGVMNLPISDNQLTKNTEFVRLWEKTEPHSSGISAGLHAETGYSKRVTAIEYRLNLKEIPAEAVKAVIREDYSGSLLELPIKQGTTYVIDKLISVASYRDSDKPVAVAADIADQCQKKGFDRMLAATRTAWDNIWKRSDVKLETDEEELQGAVRYNIFMLVQNDSAHDSHASIGARGIMHGRYKGCYFWDTEIFMLPFFLHTNPEAAKNLLMYRYHTLKDAVESAKGFSLDGARYSWMSSDTGFEQCETWDTGCCEIHITADVAYAMNRYLEVTKDEEFFKDYAAEVYLQTARYWSSRFSYDRNKEQYNLLFVKGPDEYCGVTSNNFYTVRMAVHNLKLAKDTVLNMEQKYPDEWERLKERIDFKQQEIARWEDIIEKSVTYYDETRKLWIQDDTFEKLEPLDIKAYKMDDTSLYNKLSFDRLQRYQVLKQPDVLMLMSLFPEAFSEEEQQAAWYYYEEKTLHDSTLSFSIHSMMAARLGHIKKAEEYFYKGTYLDLHDIMKNTSNEGIHVASLGASWQALVFGYAGVWVNSNGITCNPHLPEGIRKMEFTIQYNGNAYEVMVEQGGKSRIKFMGAI